MASKPTIPDSSHNPPLAERLAEDPEPPQGPLSAVQANAHRLKTREGKAGYAQRKSTVETVFGVVKQAQGFGQFLLRGLSAVQGAIGGGKNPWTDLSVTGFNPVPPWTAVIRSSSECKHKEISPLYYRLLA